MQSLCKTDKGTMAAWTYGNNWYDDNVSSKGIGFGFYSSDFAIGSFNYDVKTEEFTIKIHKELADKLGIKIIIDEK